LFYFVFLPQAKSKGSFSCWKTPISLPTETFSLEKENPKPKSPKTKPQNQTQTKTLGEHAPDKNVV